MNAEKPIPGNDKSRIYEVARQAGVSIVTVSRVFNDYPHVSEKMRHRVFAAARDVGYTPRLVSKRSLIGLLTGHMYTAGAGDYKNTLMMHIIHAAAQQGFLVEIIPGDAAELATKNLVDGIIEVGLTAQELKAMTHLPPVPTVLTNKGRLQETWYTVCSDHFEESEIAVSCLLENGHRSMALVLDEQEGWGPENRRAGFEQSLAGIPGTQGTVLSIQDMGPQQCAAELTAAGCTAAILFTDNAGFGVFDALVNDQHLHVPDDISLIMLENRSVSRFIAPRLTTIAQPLQEIAIAAVERIVQSLQDDSVQKNTVFHSCLIKRKSVRCMGQALK